MRSRDLKDRQYNGQENKGRGGGRQTLVDKTDNTMVKRIKGGEGGDKQWWTIQTTQWSRE